MIKGTPELIAGRREEIINACEKLYQRVSFREITLKEIGNLTSFSRPTIYNYFETKEEIFLALFQREYNRWNEDLTSILYGNEQMTKTELAEKIALSLNGRVQLLKLLSMNNYDMEANSRQELLTAFKQSYGRSMQLMGMLLEKFCPDMGKEDVQSFIYIFYPFMFGIYPYTAVTEKQKTAMKEAGINFEYKTIYELTYNFLVRLLQ
jgi:AcrR family transcriptional regulator